VTVTHTQDFTRALQAPAAGTISSLQEFLRSIEDFRQVITVSQQFTRSLSALPAIDVVLTGAPTGLVGTLTVAVTTESGAIITPPTINGIQETPAGTGRYVASIPQPQDVGRYFVVWNDGQNTTLALLLVILESLVQTPIKATAFSEYTIKAGDTEPALMVTLRNAGGKPVDLSSAITVTATVQRKGDIIPVAQRAAAILEPFDEGQVLLVWEAGETDLPGAYASEWAILWQGNGRSTAPSKATYRFVIEPAGI
jgi:hypothetical protein